MHLSKLETPYNETDEYQRLIYVIDRDKDRRLRWEIYILGYGVDLNRVELEMIYKELTGKYFK